jgi:hypothetical protein
LTEKVDSLLELTKTVAGHVGMGGG